ncbi:MULTISPECIES: hypothetical protein [unclassified Bradyrhizobium]|nr:MULTISPECIES: hypothetical protein [unclassified Bradyrhizobium]
MRSAAALDAAHRRETAGPTRLGVGRAAVRAGGGGIAAPVILGLAFLCGK